MGNQGRLQEFLQCTRGTLSNGPRGAKPVQSPRATLLICYSGVHVVPSHLKVTRQKALPKKKHMSQPSIAPVTSVCLQASIHRASRQERYVQVAVDPCDSIEPHLHHLSTGLDSHDSPRLSDGSGRHRCDWRTGNNGEMHKECIVQTPQTQSPVASVIWCQAGWPHLSPRPRPNGANTVNG